MNPQPRPIPLPRAHVVIDRPPRRKVMRHQAPCAAGSQDVPDTVHDFSRRELLRPTSSRACRTSALGEGGPGSSTLRRRCQTGTRLARSCAARSPISRSWAKFFNTLLDHLDARRRRAPSGNRRRVFPRRRLRRFRDRAALLHLGELGNGLVQRLEVAQLKFRDGARGAAAIHELAARRVPGARRATCGRFDRPHAASLAGDAGEPGCLLTCAVVTDHQPVVAPPLNLSCKLSEPVVPAAFRAPGAPSCAPIARKSLISRTSPHDTAPAAHKRGLLSRWSEVRVLSGAPRDRSGFRQCPIRLWKGYGKPRPPPGEPQPEMARDRK